MGSLRVPETGHVYLDSMCFIYSLEQIPPYHDLLVPFWERAHSGAINLVARELVRLETIVKPLRAGDNILVDLFTDLFESRDVRLIPLTADIWDRAARLRATSNLKTPDAIHAATALEMQCDLMVTNDPVFSRIPNLHLALLRDFVV